MNGWKARVQDDDEEWVEIRHGPIFGDASDVAGDFLDALYEADPTIIEDSESIEVEVMSPAGEVTRWEVRWDFSPSFFARQKADDRRDRQHERSK